MVQTDAQAPTATPGAAFSEGYVDADGFHIRYLQAGQGQPLVHIHGAGGPRLTRAHDLLAEQFRVIAFEVPGFGASPANSRTRSAQEMAQTMAQAIEALGLERINLWGTSMGGRISMWLASQAPDKLEALVLESPAAIIPEEGLPQAATPADRMRLLYAHPERLPAAPPPDPQVMAKQNELVAKLLSPRREPELEARFGEIGVPTLVLFGTQDRMIPPELGRIYREKMPNCHFVLVYDAGHAISSDRPEAFQSVVSDFLERHEAFVVSRQSTLINP